jgi:hypothetical protein
MTTLAIHHHQFIDANLQFGSMLPILQQFPLDLRYYIASMTGKFDVIKGKLQPVIGKLDKNMPIFSKLNYIYKQPSFAKRFRMTTKTTTNNLGEVIQVTTSTLNTRKYAFIVQMTNLSQLKIVMCQNICENSPNYSKKLYFYDDDGISIKHGISSNDDAHRPWKPFEIGAI